MLNIFLISVLDHILVNNLSDSTINTYVCIFVNNYYLHLYIIQNKSSKVDIYSSVTMSMYVKLRGSFQNVGGPRITGASTLKT